MGDKQQEEKFVPHAEDNKNYWRVFISTVDNIISLVYNDILFEVFSVAYLIKLGFTPPK